MPNRERESAVVLPPPAAYTVAREVDRRMVYLTDYYLAAHEQGVRTAVLDRARREGFSGTSDERLAELGWRIVPLYAASPAVPPPGYVMVPIEITRSMMEAGGEAILRNTMLDSLETSRVMPAVYRAMLAAASPSPQDAQDAVTRDAKQLYELAKSHCTAMYHPDSGEEWTFNLDALQALIDAAIASKGQQP